MWGRKEESDPQSAAPRTPADSGAPAQPAQAVAPSPRSSAATTSSSGVRSAAHIGKSLHLKGEITGREDLLIDGEVEGTVVLEENNLTIGPNGNVHANVKAKSLTVMGRINGNVRCSERVEIRRSGLLEGDLSTARIVIEDGAVFRGSIDIVRPAEPERAAPSVKKAAAPSTATSPSASHSGNSKADTEAARAGQP